MWKKVDDFIKKQKMFTAEDVVIAGVSGGADSMCLLCVLDNWRTQLGFRLIVVHVNHGLRGKVADAEEQYVQKICRERNILFESYHVDVRAISEQEKLSEEEAGRVCRRRAFEETAMRYGGTKIALAHHKNDNAETFLFHLARGSHLKGLGGMKPVNGKYVRPLLCVERREIEAYLREKNIEFCVDESNETDAYSRNRIRNHVLPYLTEQINGQTIEHINRTMEYFQRVQEYLEKQVAMLWEKLVMESPEEDYLVAQALMEEEPVLRDLLLRQVLARAAQQEKDLTEVHVRSLEALFRRQVGRRLDLPYGVQAVRTYEGVDVRRKGEPCSAEEEELYLRMEGEVQKEWEYKGLRITARIFPAGSGLSIPKKPFTKWFDYDIISETVCIRTRRQGDALIIDRMGNSQKLKNYFINEKVPAKEREKLLLVTEGAQVLWIVGYRQSMAYQVSEQTERILEITISGGNEDGREDQSNDSRIGDRRKSQRAGSTD